jgi:hypothetical protein
MATHALLLKDIINQTLRMAQDYFGVGYIAGRTWTRAQVIIAINQALLEWCRITGFLRKEDTVALTEDTKVYDFPDDCLQLLSIAFYSDNARSWIGEPVSLVSRDLAGYLITGSSVPIRFFLDYLPYSQFGWQPNVSDDYTAYLTFTRAHEYADTEAETLEDAIPPWFHKDIKHGAVKFLLDELKDDDPKKAKLPYCEERWKRICNRMITIKASHTPHEGMYAL